jgi:Holliday junction resolvasome RuvABC endonuclease subunit
MAVVMGLDLSLSGTGSCILKNGELIYSKTTKTEPKNSWYERIQKIRDEIIWVTHHHKPEFAFIENYSFGSKFGREIAGEVHGNVLWVLEEYKVPYFRTLSPSQIKSFYTGSGRATKSDVIEALKRKYQIQFKKSEHDQADAYAIAQLGNILFNIEKNNGALTGYEKAEIKVLKTILETLRREEKWQTLFN